MSGPPEFDRRPPPAGRPARASRSLLGPDIGFGVLLGLIGVAVVVTVGVQVPAPGGVGFWAALLLVAIGAVMGYHRARAKGHRDLAIGLLIGTAAGLVAGFGALTGRAVRCSCFTGLG
jgi:hypothetical protein